MGRSLQTLPFRCFRRKRPIHHSTHPHKKLRSPIRREAARCNQSAPPKTTKTFPQNPATPKSEIFFRSCNGGVLGESSGRMREVWREKGHPPKGGPFSLQGLPHPTSNIPSSPRPPAPRRRERRLRDGGPRRRCRCSARRGSRVKAHRPPSSSPQSASGQDAPASSP